MKRISTLVWAVLASALLNAQQLNVHKLDSLFALIEEYQKGMGSISIFRDGAEIYQKSYGLADVERGVRNTRETKFRVGSVTKTFTATIVMKLVEENKLSLFSKLSDYYPQIPNSDSITIAHLLEHRSGIANFTSVPDYVQWNTTRHTKEQILDRIVSGGSAFRPDSKFGYSNSNYALLTFIAEDVTSRTYADLLNEIIVVPCHLTNTYVGGTIDSDRSEAYSYRKMNSGWDKVGETDMSIPLGAGFIVSTPYDLNVFLHCLFSGKIVSQSSLERMTSLKDNFGLGLIKVPYFEKTGYGHTGGIDGFQTNAFYFPEDKVSVALASNGVSYLLNNILVASLNATFGTDYTLPKFSHAIEVATEELDKYLGVYSSPSLPIKLTITKKGNTLIAQGTGQPELFLECTATNVFVNDGVDLKLEFAPEENKLTLKQLGMNFEMTREGD